MANPLAPHGLNPVGTLDGNPWNGKANLYHIPSSDGLAYYIGDIVKSASTGSDVNGVPDVTRAANGANGATNATVKNRGVIVGIQVSPVGVGAQNLTAANAVNLNQTFVPATKANDYYVLVADDPNLLFEVMGNNTVTVTAGATIGLNATYIQGTPVAGDVVSRTVVDLTTTVPATTNTFPLKIVQLPYRPNVDFTANTPLLVTFNTHELKGDTGSTGV